MGDFRLGDMIARDGKTVIYDANTFGQEWQVLRHLSPASSMVRLSASTAGAHASFPRQASPSSLSESSSIDQLAAEKASANSGARVRRLRFDVLTTGDRNGRGGCLPVEEAASGFALTYGLLCFTLRLIHVTIADDR
jgi:hypothetical protein